jgi:thymidine kinase
MNSQIDIILGPMFSGKSTELLRRCNRYKAIGKSIILINHSFDTRTDSSIKTHENHKEPAVKTLKLMDIIQLENYLNCEVVGIDEAQFFEDLYEFVIYTEKLNKIIIISGLDGDSNRKPFGQILDCIPLCDSVVKLNAMDMIDKDGTPAIFSKRIVSVSDKILVGANDSYVAVSRKNYFI